jgi:hypothetical protein
MKQLGRQGPLAPRELPRFIATTTPSDSRPYLTTVIYSCHQLLAPYAWAVAYSRASQVPRGSVDARCPLSPRVVHPLHVLVASRMVSGFTHSGRLTTTTGVTRPKWVHAFALRLTSSPSRSSTTWLPTPPPSQLHGERAIAMVSTFQLTRSGRLSLTDRNTRKRKHGQNSHSCPPARTSRAFFDSILFSVFTLFPCISCLSWFKSSIRSVTPSSLTFRRVRLESQGFEGGISWPPGTCYVIPLLEL